MNVHIEKELVQTAMRNLRKAAEQLSPAEKSLKKLADQDIQAAWTSPAARALSEQVELMAARVAAICRNLEKDTNTCRSIIRKMEDTEQHIIRG